MKKILVFHRVIKKAWLKRRGMLNNQMTAQLEWKGTQVDLMEIAYGLYLTGKLVDSSGRKASLMEVTEYVFKMFGCPPPQNPSRVVTTLRQRANPALLSVMFKNLCDLYPGRFEMKK